MAVNRGTQSPTDETVSSMMSPDKAYRKIIREREKTKKQREKAERDAARKTMTFDLPIDLIEAIKTLADNTEVTYSQFAAWLLTKGIHEVVNGDWNPTEDRILSRSPLYDYKMELLPIPEIDQGNQKILATSEVSQLGDKQADNVNTSANPYANVRANARVNAVRKR